MSVATSTTIDVCLISAGLPSSNPRLVKEAAALSRGGYAVHCVVGDYPTPLRDYDAQLIAEAGATMTRVGLGSTASYRARRGVQELASRVQRLWPGDRVLARACSPQSLRLLRAAAAHPARLYLGHTLPALPAAVLAAQRHGALAGFDAEDCHSLESDDEGANQRAAAVEKHFLKRCDHLTAASPLIAEEYERRYGLTATTVLNCFDRPSDFCEEARPGSTSRPLSLYWFSQTIGPGRGLEAVIAGAAKAKADVQICLRGIVSEGYRRSLMEQARSQGLKTDLKFLPTEHPDHMISGTAAHDLGLALELTSPRNRDLCLTNKLFTYLAAGIPQIVSRTSAQERLAAELGPAAILVDLNRPAEIAAAIDRLALGTDEYERAAKEARRLYETRYSWRVESQRLVEAVGRLVAPRRPAALGAASSGDRNPLKPAGCRA